MKATNRISVLFYSKFLFLLNGLLLSSEPFEAGNRDNVNLLVRMNHQER